MKFMASGNQMREQTQSNGPILLAQHHRPPEGVVRSLDAISKLKWDPFVTPTSGILRAYPIPISDLRLLS